VVLRANKTGASMKTKPHNNDLGGLIPLMGHWSLRKSQDFSLVARYSNYLK